MQVVSSASTPIASTATTPALEVVPVVRRGICCREAAVPRVVDRAARPAPVLLLVPHVSPTTTCPMAHAFDALIPLPAGFAAKQTLQSAPHVQMGTSWTQQLTAASLVSHTAKPAPRPLSAPLSTPPQATPSSQ